MEVLSRNSLRLKPALKTSRNGLRAQTRCHSSARPGQDFPITPVAFEDKTDYSGITNAKFRELAYVPEKPLLMKAGHSFLRSGMAMPAINKWFDFVPNDETVVLRRNSRKRTAGKVMSAYLKTFGLKTILPFELAYPQAHRFHGDTIHKFIESLRQKDGAVSTMDRALAEWLETQLPPISERFSPERTPGRPKDYPHQKILRFTAPLTLLDTVITYNLSNPYAGIRKLYVAQAPLNDLPKELQADLPVPRIVRSVGKGDIYDSSIWLGLEPTYTPLHRDPNPNLFIQLCGNKIVRLLPPTSGGQLYHDVQSRLGYNLHISSRLRGPEMMDGPEKALMDKAVWDEDGPRGRQVPRKTILEDPIQARSDMQEARLQPGDALFIPMGWWHSVKSEEDHGRLNASVNWWFR